MYAVGIAAATREHRLLGREQAADLRQQHSMSCGFTATTTSWAPSMAARLPVVASTPCRSRSSAALALAAAGDDDRVAFPPAGAEQAGEQRLADAAAAEDRDLSGVRHRASLPNRAAARATVRARRASRGRAGAVASQASTARAQRRPSSIAHTISDWPRRASPAAKTPRTDVANSAASALPRASRCDAELLEQRRLRADEAHGEQDELGRVRLLAARHRLERRRAAVPHPVDPLDTPPSPRAPWSRSRSCARRPPSSAYDVRSFIGQSGQGVRSSGREAGGSPSSSIWVTDAARSRCALADAVGAGVAAADDDHVLARGADRRRRPCPRPRGCAGRGTPWRSARRRAPGPGIGRSRGTREPTASTTASKSSVELGRVDVAADVDAVAELDALRGELAEAPLDDAPCRS